MVYEKKIVCLANSKKQGGSCIAGKETANGQYGSWIRPVSDREEGEISEKEQKYADKNCPQILDIISIKLLKPLQHEYRYQTENHLIDNGACWEKKGEETWDNLEKMKDEPSELWLNGYNSFKGENDRVPIDEASKLKNSLYLIYIPSMKVHVYTNTYSAKKETRALFTYNEHKYNLSITDPKAESHFLKKQDGKYPIKNLYLCVSIGEPLEDKCYKLVASVITDPLF